MKPNEFIGKFKSKYLWGNLILMASVIVLSITVLKFGLDIYTHHGESIKIPDVRHKSFADAEAQLEMMKLKVVVSDTGYVRYLPPDCVLEQSPAPGNCVKSGHIIYITVNALHTPTLTIPDIIDNCSLREATAKLSAMGFKLGDPQLVSGEKDWVYGIIVGGRHVTTGQKVAIGKTLIIEVSDGQYNADDSINYVDPSSKGNDEQVEQDPFEEVKSPPEEETKKTNGK